MLHITLYYVCVCTWVVGVGRFVMTEEVICVAGRTWRPQHTASYHRLAITSYPQHKSPPPSLLHTHQPLSHTSTHCHLPTHTWAHTQQQLSPGWNQIRLFLINKIIHLHRGAPVRRSQLLRFWNKSCYTIHVHYTFSRFVKMKPTDYFKRFYFIKGFLWIWI